MKVMILGKLEEQIEIKKVPVIIWCLRDEIEATLAYYLTHHPSEVEKIRQFYNLSSSEFDQHIDQSIAIESKDSAAEIITSEAKIAQKQESNVRSIRPDLNKDLESYLKFRSEIKRIYPSEDKISLGYTLLSDLSNNDALIFSKFKYSPGQSVVMQLLIPNSFTLNGVINHIRNISMRSRIISDQKPNYRIRMQFNFDRPIDKKILNQFLISIANEG